MNDICHRLVFLGNSHAARRKLLQFAGDVKRLLTEEHCKHRERLFYTDKIVATSKSLLEKLNRHCMRKTINKARKRTSQQALSGIADYVDSNSCKRIRTLVYQKDRKENEMTKLENLCPKCGKRGHENRS